MTRALENLKVLDVTHVLAGPFCSYQLALFGADVIKIESPNSPDCARGRGPDDSLNALGLGLNYQVQGANKRALAINLKDPQGHKVFLELVRNADVLVENFTTGAIDRLGLSYSTLSKVNPGLVYCSLTGYGSTGPKAQTGGYDNVIQAASGTITQCGGNKPNVSFIDYATGYSAAFAVLAALRQRDKTGRGTHISVSMLEVAMTLMAPEVAAEQSPVCANRSQEAGIASYETTDGTLMIGAFRPEQYRKLGTLLSSLGHDLPELAGISNWNDVWAVSDGLRERLSAVFCTETADTWVSRLHEVDLPAEKVVTLTHAVQSEQLSARDYFVTPPGMDVPLPKGGIRMAEGGPEIRRPPPKLGEHSDEILQEAGLDTEAIASLRASGVII